MPPRKRAERRESVGSQRDPEVDAFLADLDHPLKNDYETARAILLGVSPSIRDGIKWNGPSFRTHEWFATLFLRSRDAVQFIFHCGPKAKDGATKMDVPDPGGLIRWVSGNRCIVTLGAGREIAKRRAVFEAIVRAWIRQMPSA